MAKSGFESSGLPQPDALTHITEADRPRVYEMVRKELEDRLNGPRSYYPDGGRKGAQTLSEDLDDLSVIWRTCAALSTILQT